MDKQSFGIDLDSTLNCHDEYWISRYNKDYNDNLCREDMTQWGISKYVKPECGNKIDDYLLEPNFFRYLKVKPYAQEVTKWLSQYFNLFVVTAYLPITCLDKAEWIGEYFPHIPQKNIIFCNNKGLVHTKFLVDDGGHNIIDYHNSNKSGLSIVFDAPWNRYLGNQFIRAYDWIDVKEIIKEQLYFN